MAGIDVLDAKHEHAAALTREVVSEDRGISVAEMEQTGRARGEASRGLMRRG